MCWQTWTLMDGWIWNNTSQGRVAQQRTQSQEAPSMFWLDSTARDLKVRAEYMMVERPFVSPCDLLVFVFLTREKGLDVRRHSGIHLFEPQLSQKPKKKKKKKRTKSLQRYLGRWNLIVMTWTSANVFNRTTGCFDKKQCRRLKRTTIDKLCMYVNRNVFSLPTFFFKEMRELILNNQDDYYYFVKWSEMWCGGKRWRKRYENYLITRTRDETWSNFHPLVFFPGNNSSGLCWRTGREDGRGKGNLILITLTRISPDCSGVTTQIYPDKRNQSRRLWTHTDGISSR